jgi:hypothetical protein
MHFELTVLARRTRSEPFMAGQPTALSAPVRVLSTVESPGWT